MLFSPRASGFCFSEELKYITKNSAQFFFDKGFPTVEGTHCCMQIFQWESMHQTLLQNVFFWAGVSGPRGCALIWILPKVIVVYFF